MKASLSKSRNDAFSDGVIAILLTIMAFDLKIQWDSGTAQSIWTNIGLQLGPKLMAYGMSYAVIAILWINHHALFDAVEKVTGSLIWLNVLLLFVMSLIPMATNYLASYPLQKEAVQLYGLVLTFNAGVFAWLRHHASATLQLITYQPKLFRRNLLATSLYLSSVGMAWISVVPSYCIFLVIPLMYFIPPFKSEKP